MPIWLPVKRFVGYYEVSDEGVVRSVPRTIVRSDGVVQHLKGKVLNAAPKKINQQVYQVVCLCKDGKSTFEYLHRVVAEAFIPNPRNFREVNHKDLNKSNNRADNLEWKSSSGNKKHAVRNGVKNSTQIRARVRTAPSPFSRGRRYVE